MLFFFFFHVPELRSSSCGNPGVPPKGILNGTQFNVGDKIRYRCVTGYVLDGHSLLTCVTNAAGVSVWDFPVPICRGEDTCYLKWVTNCMWGEACLFQTFFFFYLGNVTAGYHWEYLILSTYSPKKLKISRWLVSFDSSHLVSSSCSVLIAF